MRELDQFRRATERMAARESGLPADQERTFVGHQQMAGRETQVLRLPVIPTTSQIQDPDTGEFTFMLDFSILDGSDPLG